MNTLQTTMPVTVPLYRLAHGRTGDKGNRSNISLIAWNAACWRRSRRLAMAVSP